MREPIGMSGKKQTVKEYIQGKYKSDNEQRAFCFRCWKVEALCLCSVIPELESPVKIGLLQHPNERYMPINTARFTHLGLKNSSMYHGVVFNDNPQFMNDFKMHTPEKSGVLFPSPHAKDLSEAPDDLEILYVIDGTWREAKKMIFNSQVLHTVPHYAFNPDTESNYRIRKEPKKNFVSTVEAVVKSLRILEKRNDGYEELLKVFDTMVENQLHYINSNPHSRHRDNKERRRRRRIQSEENNKSGLS